MGCYECAVVSEWLPANCQLSAGAFKWGRALHVHVSVVRSHTLLQLLQRSGSCVDGE